MAARNTKAGEKVYECGVPIDSAKAMIAEGAKYICITRRVASSPLTPRTKIMPSSIHSLTLQGFLNSDGRKEIRNWIIVA